MPIMAWNGKLESGRFLSKCKMNSTLTDLAFDKKILQKLKRSI